MPGVRAARFRPSSSNFQNGPGMSRAIETERELIASPRTRYQTAAWSANEGKILDETPSVPRSQPPASRWTHLAGNLWWRTLDVAVRGFGLSLVVIRQLALRLCSCFFFEFRQYHLAGYNDARPRTTICEQIFNLG